MSIVLALCFIGALESIAIAQTAPVFEPFRKELEKALANGSTETLELIGVGIAAPAVSEIANPDRAREFVLTFVDQIPPGSSFRSSFDAIDHALENGEVAWPAGGPGVAANDAEWKRVLLKRRGLWDFILSRHPPPQPSAKWLAYQREAREYASAVDAHEKSPTPANEALLKQAAQEWEVLGFRAEVDAALDRHQQSIGGDPAVWWARVREDVRTLREQLVTTPLNVAVLSASPEDWQSEVGWVRLQANGVAGGASVDVEVKRVALQRPWIPQTMLTSREWRRKRDAGGNPLGAPLSFGTPGTVTNEETLPFIATGLLLARKGKIRNADGLEVTLSEPQIIGWFSRRTPQAPDPDTSRLWPGDVIPQPIVERGLQVTLGVMTAISFPVDADAGNGGRRGQIGPVPYIGVAPSKWVRLVVAPGLGVRLRGTGLLVGLSLPTPVRNLGVIVGFRTRLTSADEPPNANRVVLGVGYDVLRRPW